MAAGEFGGPTRLTASRSNDGMANSTKALLLILRPIRHRTQFIERQIRFEAGTVVPVGRASSTESKHLVEAPDNGYVVCPVMSRDHAKIECRSVDRNLKLYIRDLHSSHGTKVNDNKLTGEHELVSGDTIEFGAIIVRGSDTFHPPKYAVDIEEVLKPHAASKLKDNSSPQKTPVSGFTVPESDESDEYSEGYSDEEEEIRNNSSPTSASSSARKCKPGKDVDLFQKDFGRELTIEDLETGTQILDYVLGDEEDFNHHGLDLDPKFSQKTKDQPTLEINSPDLADDFEDDLPSTGERPISSTHPKFSREESSVPPPHQFEYESDAESEAMPDTHPSDLDVDDSDYDREISASPMLKPTFPSAPVAIAAGSAWMAEQSSGELIPPPYVYQESRPNVFPNMHAYQAGPFSFAHPRPSPTAVIAPEFYFTDAGAVPSAESQFTNYEVPEPLIFNGPQHITSSTSDQVEASTLKPHPFEAFQPTIKSPLTKSMSIENIINADNAISRKRKLDEVDDTVQGASKGANLGPGMSVTTTTADDLDGNDCENDLRGSRGIRTVDIGNVDDEIPSIAKSAAEPLASQPSTEEAQPETTPITEPTVEQSAPNEQRPEKKRKTALAFFTGTAVGAIIGSIGTVAGLACVPENYFA